MAGHPDRTSDILEAVALLVVDMQATVLKIIPDAETVTARCGLAVEAARTCGLKVIFTEQVPDKLGGTDPRLRALAPDARVFAKQSFSALQADGLQDYLKQHGIYHLLLTGIETPVCVYQTALHAADFEFDVTVLTDCVAGRRHDDGRTALESLARSNCHLLPAETVFYSMLATSAHPKFRAFTEVVKRYAGPDPLAAPPRAPQPEVAKNSKAGTLPPKTEAARSRRGGRRRKPKSPDNSNAAATTEASASPQSQTAPVKSSPATAVGGAQKSHPRRRRGGVGRQRGPKTKSGAQATASRRA